MRVPVLLALGAMTLAPATSEAQVSGTIIIGGGPVGGVITVGDQRRRREVIVVERRAPRLVVVERVERRKHRNHPVFGHRGRHDYAVVYYDRRHRAYYDRYRPGLVEIRVIRRGNRYYLLDERDGRRARPRGRGWDR